MDGRALSENDPAAGASNEISGGVFFHAVIQGRNITVQLPQKITPALSGLPTASPTFTGRDIHLDELLEDLAPRAEGQQPVLVSAVAGLAGVGKTELAVQVANRARQRPGWFPGGVLFVDLFGYDAERRLSPEQALDGLLRALGIPGEHIPNSLQDRTRLYRSVLAAFAEQGQRILVVIDNASSAEQSCPLLPTDGTTATLITSRHILNVGARLRDLDTLNDAASIELLRQALQQSRGDADTRVADAPAAAAAIARLCAGLPLALRIAAALLADTPRRPLSSLAHALEAEHSRLDRLRREEAAVRAAFDLSYRLLDDAHARLFRLLPLNPGPDVSTEAATHLVGKDANSIQVEEALQDLARAHLIENGHVWGRWRLHDLVRLYADEHGRDHADRDQRPNAQSRLYDHYEHMAAVADTHITTRPSARSSVFPNRDAALEWLDAERDNLLASVTSARVLGKPATSTALALSLARYLDLRHFYDSGISVTTTALAIVRDTGDRHGEGKTLTNLGNVLARVRRFDEALAAQTQAVAIFREIGNRHLEGTALSNLGNILQELRRFEEAIHAKGQAASVFREIGHRSGEGRALSGLGDAFQHVRMFEEAIAAYTQAARAFRETDDRHGEGQNVGSLGIALRQVHRFEEAIDAHTQAIDIVRATGHRHEEGMALSNLGLALHDVRRFNEAIHAHTQAVGILREVGDHNHEGMALSNLGNALAQVSRFDEAINAHTQAADIFREIGNRHLEGTALSNLGNTLQELCRYEEAIHAYSKDLTVCREIGDRFGEGQTLHNLGLALQQVRRYGEAIIAHTQAADTFRDTGDRHVEGTALLNLGNELAQVRRFDEAIDAFTQAARVFRKIGDRHREEAALLAGTTAHNERWLLKDQ
ncbi:tetratricopeptide repeat-containing protein [Streptomyces sp. WAC 05379]|uniref:tetratricopeptide repeat protein n=1 Tax=Streptomyces sp. WAC 05379 TaxID=2203207 RepID=UPI000F747AA5|nr:tetratricopeptide repeat protein [Streptomyces sp. WAC 05379]RSO09126.1 tetratricopeptide repeat-containing protein [Streptomyces sp. WAC 05379]